MARVGIYTLPPRKTFRWTSLHNYFVIGIAIHFILLFLVPIFMPKNPKDRVVFYDVDLVKNYKKPEEKKKEEKPKVVEQKTQTKTAGDPKKAPGAKTKSEKVSDVKGPPKKDRTKPNVPLKIDVPKATYPTVDPNSLNVQVSPKANAHEDGAPSGTEDGVLGSNGYGGDGYGEGGGGDGEGGGGGGGGGGGVHPWVYWGWNNFMGIERELSLEENIQMYMDNDTTDPYLIDAVVPSYTRLIGLGTGQVVFRITIPSQTQLPRRGISPINIKVIKVNADNRKNAKEMEYLATECVEASGWYPAKNNGTPYEKTITLTLYFYSGEE